MDDVAQPPANPSVGKIIFWVFLALLVLMLVWQFFEIQDKCFYYEGTDRWQKAFC